MTIDRAEAPIGLPPRVLRIPRTTAVDRRSNSIHPGGPTSSSADFFGAPATLGAALGSSLIT